MKSTRGLRAVLGLFLGLLGCAAAASAADDSSLVLDRGWRFIKGDPAGAEATTFDASAWETVTVPHTWNLSDWQEMSGYYRGPGWYRRTLEIPKGWKGQRVFIRFDAASTAAEVYVNGRRAGQHKGAFAAFVFELTPLVNVDGPTVIAVRVTNARVDDIPPLGGDFNLFGGLYRTVTVFARDPLCITPLDLGSPGIAVKQAEVTPSRATIEVTAKVSNGRSSASPADVIVRVLDAAGELVAQARTTAQLPAGATQAVSQWLSVSNPHLWNGVADPYLHSVLVEVRSAGVVVDRQSQPLGLRFYRVDPQRGFFLNGKSYPLHGVNRHQDRQGLGWALTEAAQDEDLRLLKEIGANTVRLAHYQHSDYFYSLCDKAGLIAWAEIPLVNEVNGTEAFNENARQQLVELIRQNINHPSIAFWSIYNEVGLRTKVDPTPLVTSLYPVAKAEDATRPVVAATSQGELSKFPNMVATPDLLAANLYPGWYSAAPDDMGPLVDQWNTYYGSRGLAISEYGAGASPRQHEQGMTKRPTPTGNWHPEEWQAIQHERNYAALVTRPFVWATWVWNMFDFASSGRSEGDTPGINDKGLITYDRTLKKDAFFFYKANWNAEPMVYITSRRHTARTSAVTDVKVYSSCPQVTLRVNGRVLADAAGSPIRVFVWTGVTLAAGENVIVAEARCAGKAVSDEVRWTYAQPTGTRYGSVVFDSVSIAAEIGFRSATDASGVSSTLRLDVYAPAGDSERLRPAILWIHGGGFRAGTDKSQKYLVALATEFAKRGYVSVAPDYRVRTAALTDADRMPALENAVIDCRAALLWLSSNAANMGVDPKRIAIAGGSAGGMTAVSLAALETASPQKGLAAPFALIDLWGSPAASLRMGSIDAKYPPTLIVHGTADQAVPFAQSEALAAQLKTAGVRHELMPIEGAAHTPTDHLDAIIAKVSAFLFEALPKR